MKKLILLSILASLSFAQELKQNSDNSAELLEAKKTFSSTAISKDRYRSILTYNKMQESFQKYCNNGNGEACNYMGILYLSGKVVNQNRKKAQEYFSLSCSLGYEIGCLNRDIM